MKGLDLLVTQDADRLLDFDYTNEDIDSLRRQMTLPDQSGITTNPGSPSSDLLGSLGMTSKVHSSIAGCTVDTYSRSALRR